MESATLPIEAQHQRTKKNHPHSARAQKKVIEMFKRADVEIDGHKPCDIRVCDTRFYERVLRDGSLGFGEAYMLGWWDCDDIEEMCARAIRSGIEEALRPSPRALADVALAMLLNLQTRSRSKVVARRHYDLGNDFFGAMLDPAMQYSCAYFHGTADLARAQELKMELICKKLHLRPGDHLLDIGCGWGGLARFAAEHHGCRVTGITISAEQQAYAEAHCEGLPVEIRLQDYRDADGCYDAIASVGMFEHVGPKNHRTFMHSVRGLLKPGGLFLCHTITGNTTGGHPDRFISRHIFANSAIPSATEVLQAAEGLFVNEDMHNLGPYYVPTLRAWEAGFMRASEEFRSRFGEEFVRMWRFYLLSCSAAFRARRLQVFQFLFSRDALPLAHPLRIS